MRARRMRAPSAREASSTAAGAVAANMSVRGIETDIKWVKNRFSIACFRAIRDDVALKGVIIEIRTVSMLQTQKSVRDDSGQWPGRAITKFSGTPATLNGLSCCQLCPEIAGPRMQNNRRLGHVSTLVNFFSRSAAACRIRHRQCPNAYTARPMNLRAGPNRDYPAVAQLDAGAPLDVHGCLDGYSWCDVSFEDARGWLYAGGISFVYNGDRVPLYFIRTEAGPAHRHVLARNLLGQLLPQPSLLCAAQHMGASQFPGAFESARSVSRGTTAHVAWTTARQRPPRRPA